MQERLSISISADDAQWIRDEAEKRGTSISGMISRLVRSEKLHVLREQIMQGVIEDAELNIAMANDDWVKVAEIEARG